MRHNREGGDEKQGLLMGVCECVWLRLCCFSNVFLFVCVWKIMTTRQRRWRAYVWLRFFFFNFWLTLYLLAFLKTSNKGKPSFLFNFCVYVTIFTFNYWFSFVFANVKLFLTLSKMVCERVRVVFHREKLCLSPAVEYRLQERA